MNDVVVLMLTLIFPIALAIIVKLNESSNTIKRANELSDIFITRDKLKDFLTTLPKSSSQIRSDVEDLISKLEKQINQPLIKRKVLFTFLGISIFQLIVCFIIANYTLSGISPDELLEKFNSRLTIFDGIFNTFQKLFLFPFVLIYAICIVLVFKMPLSWLSGRQRGFFSLTFLYWFFFNILILEFHIVFFLFAIIFDPLTGLW